MTSSAPPTFTFFPSLPTELRLKIWTAAAAVTPPRALPFSLVKSDLDYLRLRRKACHNDPHIFCSRLPAPALLHSCREARAVALKHYTLGFDIYRIMAQGRGDTDVDTYTTCSHEVALNDEGRGVYWDRAKDVVVLDDLGRLDEQSSAYVWGGRTGVRFGRMRRVAMTWDAVTSAGIGTRLQWESLDVLCVLVTDNPADADNMNMNDWVTYDGKLWNEANRLLKNGRVTNSEGKPPEVEMCYKTLKSFGKYIAEGLV